MFGYEPFPIVKHYKCKKKSYVKKREKTLLKKRSHRNLSEGSFSEKEKSLLPKLSVLFMKETSMPKIYLREKIKSL